MSLGLRILEVRERPQERRAGRELPPPGGGVLAVGACRASLLRVRTSVTLDHLGSRRQLWFSVPDAAADFPGCDVKEYKCLVPPQPGSASLPQ